MRDQQGVAVGLPDWVPGLALTGRPWPWLPGSSSPPEADASFALPGTGPAPTDHGGPGLFAAGLGLTGSDARV